MNSFRTFRNGGSLVSEGILQRSGEDYLLYTHVIIVQSYCTRTLHPPPGRKTALVASLCVRVCVSFLFRCLRWSFDRLVDDGVVGGLLESSKEKC